MSKFLTRKRVTHLEDPDLLEKLQLEQHFFAYLRKFNVIDNRQIETIKAIKTPVERRAELLRLIQTEEDYTGFICALLQTNQKAIVTNILCENPGDFNKEAGHRTGGATATPHLSTVYDDRGKRLMNFLRTREQYPTLIQILDVSHVMIAHMAKCLGPDEEAELKKAGQTDIEKATKLLDYLKRKSGDAGVLFLKGLEATKQSGILEILQEEGI